MTCEDCKYFEECMKEADRLGQVFDPTFDGENYCGFNKFTPNLDPQLRSRQILVDILWRSNTVPVLQDALNIADVLLEHGVTAPRSMLDAPARSAALCRSCLFSANYCKNCSECAMGKHTTYMGDDVIQCLCTTVKDGAPCPYYIHNPDYHKEETNS